jgi:hypothetical protein
MITQKSALSPFAPPGTAEYIEATASYNVSAQPAPRGALVARTSRDVVRAVRAADRLGLGLFVQATGHSAGSAAPMDDGLLVRTAFDAPVAGSRRNVRSEAAGEAVRRRFLCSRASAA